MLEQKIFEYGAPLLREFCQRNDVKASEYWTEWRLIDQHAREALDRLVPKGRQQSAEYQLVLFAVEKGQHDCVAHRWLQDEQKELEPARAQRKGEQLETWVQLRIDFGPDDAERLKERLPNSIPKRAKAVGIDRRPWWKPRRRRSAPTRW